MMCVDANQDGKVDFNEFTDRFHNPAKDIGFTMAVLLTNLSEHMPNDPRSNILCKFDKIANCLIPTIAFHQDITPAFDIDVKYSKGRISRREESRNSYNYIECLINSL